jgi:SAM-dependent methyltransferase
MLTITRIKMICHPKNWLSFRLGFCPICNGKSLFILNSPPELMRNHAVCMGCGSCSRHRHLALTLLRAFSNIPLASLSDFRRHPEIRILNTSTQGPLAEALGNAENIIHSEYIDDAKPGEIRNQIMNQDLQNLSFSNDSLDVILSEDVLEHIPDIEKAFREIHRVLKPCGVHIFTIPYQFDKKSRPLFELKGGKPRLFEPIEYHGDPFRGQIPCYHAG